MTFPHIKMYSSPSLPEKMGSTKKLPEDILSYFTLSGNEQKLFLRQRKNNSVACLSSRLLGPLLTDTVQQPSIAWLLCLTRFCIKARSRAGMGAFSPC